MTNLDDLKTEFNALLTNAGVTGTTLSILTLLLSRSVYENSINDISAILESSPSRCLNLDSSITHARDKGYSVYRGTNQKFKVSNLIAIRNFTVNKFDLCIQVDGLQLVFANTYQFSTNEVCEVELIVCDQVITSDITVTNDKSIKLDLLRDNISEDLAVSRNPLGENVSYNIYDKFKDLYIFTSNDLLVLTNTGYSISLYNKTFFRNGDVIRIKYIPLTSLTVATSSISVIPNFTNVNTSLTIESILGTDPLTDKAKIYYYSLESQLTDFVVRSNVDIISVIDEYFTDRIGGFNVVVGPEIHKIKIYYTTLNNSDITDLITEFLAIVEKAYFISESLEFVRSTPMTVTLNLDVYWKDVLPTIEIETIINKYQLIVGKTINLYQLIAEFVESPNVVYVNPVDQLGIVALGVNNNIQFSKNINYVHYRPKANT